MPIRLGEAYRNVAGEVDGKVGDFVAIGIALKGGDPKRAVIAVVEFAGRSIKARRTR